MIYTVTEYVSDDYRATMIESTLKGPDGVTPQWTLTLPLSIPYAEIVGSLVKLEEMISRYADTKPA